MIRFIVSLFLSISFLNLQAEQAIIEFEKAEEYQTKILELITDSEKNEKIDSLIIRYKTERPDSSNHGPKEILDFSALDQLKNLKELTLQYTYRFLDDYSFYYKEMGASLLSLPDFMALEKLTIDGVTPTNGYYTGYESEEATQYKIDFLKNFFIKLSSYASLESLTLMNGFFQNSEYNPYNYHSYPAIWSQLPQLKKVQLINVIYRQYQLYTPPFLDEIDQLSQLRELTIASSKLHSTMNSKEAALKLLNKIATLDSLEVLNLHSVHLYYDDLTLPPMPNLKHLDLVAPGGSKNGRIIPAIPLRETYPELEFLNISDVDTYQRPLPFNFSALDAHSNLKGLIADILTIDAAAIEQLNHIFLPNLIALSMQNSAVRNVEWSQIAPQLVSLDLGESEVGGKDIAEISKLKELQELSLASTKISGPSIKKLATLQQLQFLNLSGNKLPKADFSLFMSSSKLEFIDLRDTELLMDDLEGLKLLTHLKTIDLRSPRNPNITLELIQEVQIALPNTQVLY